MLQHRLSGIPDYCKSAVVIIGGITVPCHIHMWFSAVQGYPQVQHEFIKPFQKENHPGIMLTIVNCQDTSNQVLLLDHVAVKHQLKGKLAQWVTCEYGVRYHSFLSLLLTCTDHVKQSVLQNSWQISPLSTCTLYLCTQTTVKYDILLYLDLVHHGKTNITYYF